MSLSIQSSVNQVLSIAQSLALRRRQETDRAQGIELRESREAERKQKAVVREAERKSKETLRAQEALKKAQEQKRASRRNFAAYMQNEPTSFGKFKDLPANVQKEVLKQYTKSQRQTIMNKMDAQKGAKK